MIDALGRPKAPWYALRRVLQPVVVLLTDEGLNGLRLHVVNDTGETVEGTVAVQLFARGELFIEEGRRAVSIPARHDVSLDVLDLFDGFIDLTASFGFGPPAYDVVVVQLLGAGGELVSEAFHLPMGVNRPVEPDVGLQARAATSAEGSHSVAVSTRRFAQFVAVDIPGFRPEDSWFHLAPGTTRTLGLVSVGGEQPQGYVRALNSRVKAHIGFDEEEG